jgi:hypothetical protein
MARHYIRLKQRCYAAEKNDLVQTKIDRHKRALELSNLVRPLVRTSRPVLFHGTRYANQVLGEDRLLCVNVGSLSVHFTRDLPVATHWAMLPRINGDEGVGAVLVFDRDRLAQDYSLKCFRDTILDNGTYPPHYNEADEIVFQRDVVGLHKYVIDVIWIDELSKRVRSAKQAREDRASRCIGLGRSELPRQVPQLLSAEKRTSAKTSKSRAERRLAASRTWASISAAERSAITNVRTVFRDLLNPDFGFAVFLELAKHMPSDLAKAIVQADKPGGAAGRKRRRKGSRIDKSRMRKARTSKAQRRGSRKQRPAAASSLVPLTAKQHDDHGAYRR